MSDVVKVLLVPAMLVLVGFAVARARAAEVAEDLLAKVRAAAPGQAAAAPAKARKVLVYSQCAGYRHKSIPLASQTVCILGEKTGAYETVISDDLTHFEADKLAGFDAIVLNNTTGELFQPSGKMSPANRKIAAEHGEKLRENLLAFVAGGKGIVGIHAATDCSYKWREYGEMMGGYFDGHPWNQTVGIKIDRPDHPVNAAFGGEGFEIADEIYQFGPGRAKWDPYSRDDRIVLLSLDMDKTPDKGKRSDDDYAVSWVKPHGRGRVFYCSLGHRDSVFTTPAVLGHYLAGIQFALGDLDAPMTPDVSGAKGDAAACDAADDGEWTVLFNGKDLTGWDGKPDGWTVEDGAIAWRPGCGFLWSEKTYGEFVLSLEFKVSPKANSGVFFRTGSRRGWLHSGIEMQVLDSHDKDKPGKHDAGAIYDIKAPRVNAVKPPDEWNQVTITARGSRIHIVMNGQEIIDIDLDDWTQPHKNPDGSRNKFKNAYKDMPRKGYIGFQDHGRKVWYRNIRIKELGDE